MKLEIGREYIIKLGSLEYKVKIKFIGDELVIVDRFHKTNNNKINEVCYTKKYFLMNAEVFSREYWIVFYEYGGLMALQHEPVDRSQYKEVIHVREVR